MAAEAAGGGGAVNEADSELLGRASGYSNGIRTSVARMRPFSVNVANIQYRDLVLILPPDSIIESSNMGNLG